MIPGMVGKNIALWMRERHLPKAVSRYGRKTGDLMSLTEEAERISGIPYVMRAYREEADRILRE